MTKARDLANASTALSAVTATELGYVDGVTSAIQTQIDAKLATTTASSTYLASATASSTYAPLSSATLTTPTINDSVTNYPTFKSPSETTNIVASAATGTINIDVETAGVWYYTSNATANHTLNFRYNSGTSLSSKLSVGESVTVVWITPNGTTAYYPNTIQVDGSSVTPKVQGGSAITGGNASATDIYSFTIVKTAATPTYLVLESQSKFA
jgi:hypothetical protein